MSSNLIYYVYAYLRPDGSPYYIGKGKNDRAFVKHQKLPVPKDRSRIVFLEQNLSEIGAFALERRYIKWYGRKDEGTGILRNLTSGGEGSSGYTHTEDTKRQIAESKTGLTLSSLHKQKISNSLTGKKQAPSIAKARAKIGNTNNRGRRWFNDGLKSIMAFDCPKGFKNGRLIPSKALP